MRLTAIEPLARRQHGLVHLLGAQALGISRSAWYRAIDAGALELVHPGVARLVGTPDSLQQRVLAAVLTCGDGAMSSHRSSARLWSIERPDDDPIDIILPRRALHSLPGNVVVHRPRDSRDLRPVVRDGIPTTNVLRMLLDLGAVDQPAVYEALVTAVANRATTPRAVDDALARHSQRGRHGVVPLRDALEEFLGESAPPDSELELRMRRLIVRFGLPAVTFHARAAGFEVDFLITGTNIVLECNGWYTHGLNRDQFEFDQTRTGVLIEHGYVVVPFTWKMVTQQPHVVASRIRKVVATSYPYLLASPSGSGSSRLPGKSSPRS